MARPTVIPLVRYQDVLWALSVHVGGQAALFLLDTAAGLTVLDRALADRLGVRTHGTFRGQRMTGEVVTLELAQGVDLALGGRTVRHETVGVFDLAGLMPADWPPVGGAIGLPSFSDLPVVIDLPGRCLRLDAALHPADRALSVRARRDGPAVDLFLEVRTATRPLWFEVDTANTGPVILSPDAAAALELGPDASTAALDLAGFGEVVTSVVVKPIRYDGNVGSAFLAARPLMIDLSAERAWMRREPGAEEGGQTG